MRRAEAHAAGIYRYQERPFVACSAHRSILKTPPLSMISEGLATLASLIASARNPFSSQENGGASVPHSDPTRLTLSHRCRLSAYSVALRIFEGRCSASTRDASTSHSVFAWWRLCQRC